MATPTTNFSYDEFHVFVMLYAANADGNITPEEEALMTPLLDQQHYASVKEIFQQCNDNEALDCIFSYRDKYLSSKEDRDTILKDMARIYIADQSFESIERGVHQLFERMLNSL